MKKFNLLMELRFGIEGSVPEGVNFDEFRAKLLKTHEEMYRMQLLQVLIMNNRNPEMVSLKLSIESEE